MSPAARRRLTSLADLSSCKAVIGKITRDAPLSAIAIGFMSFAGTKILAEVRNTLLFRAFGATRKFVFQSRDVQISGPQTVNGLNILDDQTTTRLILGLDTSNTLGLDCQSLPNTLLPCGSVETPPELTMYSYKATRTTPLVANTPPL